jgi:hypothetical protein
LPRFEAFSFDSAGRGMPSRTTFKSCWRLRGIGF